MSIHLLSERSDVLNIEELKNRCLGNMEFAIQVLDLLTDRAEADIVALEEALAKSDSDRVFHIAHRLKGSFANASAVRMSTIAEELCTASQSQDHNHMQRAAGELRDQWNEFLSLMNGSSQDARSIADSSQDLSDLKSNTLSV